jgi:hypothetical protein
MNKKLVAAFGGGRRLVAYVAVLTMLVVTLLSWAPGIAMANSDNGGGVSYPN